MPRRNALKDSIKIYYAYRLGINSNSKEVFSEVQSVIAYLSDRDGSAPDDKFGTDNNYDVSFLIPKTIETQYFDKYTKVWIYSTPQSSGEQADYKIVAEPNIRDGQIYVRCQSVAIDNHNFYYEYNGDVIRFTAIWNEANSVFYTPSNMYLPIDEETKLWFVEPDSIEDEVGLIKLLSKTEYKKYTEYAVEINGEEI